MLSLGTVNSDNDSIEARLLSSISMRIGEKTDDQSLQMLAKISKSVDAFAEVSRILEDDNMAAKPVKIDNFRNTFDLPLHTVEKEVPSFKHRRSSIVNFYC